MIAETKNPVIFLVVTPDRYELPIAVGDSLADIARTYGIDDDSIYHRYKKCNDIPIGRPRRGTQEKFRIRKVVCDDADDV